MIPDLEPAEDLPPDFKNRVKIDLNNFTTYKAFIQKRMQSIKP